ncbi:MAG: hypothetical protein U0797_12925 [Gemmataceae bacterium]
MASTTTPRGRTRGRMRYEAAEARLVVALEHARDAADELLALDPHRHPGDPPGATRYPVDIPRDRAWLMTVEEVRHLRWLLEHFACTLTDTLSLEGDQILGRMRGRNA